MKTRNFAFTVMEILIVVAILVVVSIVAVPQFTKANTENQLSEMVNNLQKIRSQITLYKVEHDNLLPGQQKDGADVTENDFAVAMLTCGPDGFGPYLKSIPKNPFNQLSTITCVNDPLAAPTGNEKTGWWFNSATGEFRACDNSFHAVY